MENYKDDLEVIEESINLEKKITKEDLELRKSEYERNRKIESEMKQRQVRRYSNIEILERSKEFERKQIDTYVIHNLTSKNNEEEERERKEEEKIMRLLDIESQRKWKRIQQQNLEIEKLDSILFHKESQLEDIVNK